MVSHTPVFNYGTHSEGRPWTPLITAAMQAIKMMQTTQTLIIKSQVTAISIETQTNQIMQTQQMIGIATR